MNMTSSLQLVCPGCGAINRVPSQKMTQAPLCGKCRVKLLPGHPIVTTDQNFNRYAGKTDLPVVVDFWAPWCGPCQQFAPVYSAVAAEMSNTVAFLKLDTEANPNVAAHYQIRSIPTLMLLHKGREVTRLSGALPKSQFQQWLNQQLLSLRG
ncbi:MAG: thioredoxin TrxC [Pseudomonadales bacterium]|nr:thioredoxin TrxC [Pseudomonadales bacterium]